MNRTYAAMPASTWTRGPSADAVALPMTSRQATSYAANVRAGTSSGFSPGTSHVWVRPPATAVGNDSAFQRGTNAYTVTSSAQFQKVFVSVATGTGGAIVDGFFQIDLSAPTTAVDLLVNFGDALPAAGFAVRFQVASPGGAVGGTSSGSGHT